MQTVSIHKLLHSCSELAIKWKMIKKKPTAYASHLKADYAKREIRTAETLFQALETCHDEHLRLAMHASLVSIIQQQGIIAKLHPS